MYRVRSAMVQTPIIEMGHPETGSSVSLIGMIHIGHPDYYAAISEYVDARETEGYGVHYERVRGLAAPLDGPVIGPNSLRSSFPDVPPPVISPAPRTAGIINQNDVLAHRPGWKNFDMDAGEVRDALGDEKYVNLKMGFDRMERIRDPDEVEGIPLWIMSATVRAVPLVMRAVRVWRGKDEMDTVLLEQRNQRAIQGVAETIAADRSANIALIWGSAHAPGIRKGLKQLGYKQTWQRWVNALPVRSFAAQLVPDNLD